MRCFLTIAMFAEDLLGLFGEVSATGTTLFGASDFNRSQRAVFAVIIVFAVANVAFDVFVFVLHIIASFLNIMIMSRLTFSDTSCVKKI